MVPARGSQNNAQRTINRSRGTGGLVACGCNACEECDDAERDTRYPGGCTPAVDCRHHLKVHWPEDETLCLSRRDEIMLRHRPQIVHPTSHGLRGLRI